ncbi:MAG TPA: hypothetical protein VNQ99_17530 [Xanthobacteraceae bacterium]|nr:hypothetical protein [Xanthobacteraceae bacterium]
MVLACFNLLWALKQSSWDIDQGLATLFGAFFGLSVVAWQTERGFKNLVKAQAAQAKLDRESREHAFALQMKADADNAERELRALLSAFWAEIIAVQSAVTEQVQATRLWGYMIKSIMEAGRPAAGWNVFKQVGFEAPIYQANAAKIGIINPSLGADIVRVLSKASSSAIETKFEEGIDYGTVFTLYQAREQYLVEWLSELNLVASRIAAANNGHPDPGTLASTLAVRKANFEFALSGQDGKS